MPVDGGIMGTPENFFPEVTPDLISGIGHGHKRGPDIPERNKLKKLRKKTKMRKASKRRNRK